MLVPFKGEGLVSGISGEIVHRLRVEPSDRRIVITLRTTDPLLRLEKLAAVAC